MIQALAGLGRNFDHLGVATEAFDDDFVLQQFIDDVLRLGARLVHLVDRDDDRRLGRTGVVDGFDRLRHDAVIRRNDQHDEIRHVGATGPHRREGGVARRVEEGDTITRRRPHLIGADVLGNATGFAGRGIGLAQGVEQRGLAVVDVTHDRNHRRTGDGMVFVVLGRDKAFFDVGFRHTPDGVAEFRSDQFGRIGIDDVVDLQHHALLHQELNDVHGAHGHPVGQLLHGDDVRNDDFTRGTRLFGRMALALFTFTFTRPADRGQRTHAFGGILVIPDNGLKCQAAFAALGFATRLRYGLGRRAGLAALGPGVILVTANFAGLGGSGRATGRTDTIDFGRRRRIGRDTGAGTRRTR